MALSNIQICFKRAEFFFFEENVDSPKEEVSLENFKANAPWQNY